MSLQEKWAFEREKVVRSVGKQALKAGNSEFASIKQFVVDNSLVPKTVDPSRFVACIIHLMREEKWQM